MEAAQGTGHPGGGRFMFTGLGRQLFAMNVPRPRRARAAHIDWLIREHVSAPAAAPAVEVRAPGRPRDCRRPLPWHVTPPALPRTHQWIPRGDRPDRPAVLSRPVSNTPHARYMTITQYPLVNNGFSDSINSQRQFMRLRRVMFTVTRPVAHYISGGNFLCFSYWSSKVWWCEIHKIPRFT